jgi:hypothetical protein
MAGEGEGKGVRQWGVESSSDPELTHTVRRYGDDAPDRWTCSCLGFLHGSRQKLNYSCRHIRELKQQLVKEFTDELG